jgi:hypothetical protein
VFGEDRSYHTKAESLRILKRYVQRYAAYKGIVPIF